eukprot:3927183-Alexandrium_andersonii.AAC.1
MIIADGSYDLAGFFQPVPESERHMEDLSEGQSLAKDWAKYKEAVLRPRRWIDGIGVLASADALGVNLVIVQWCRRKREWLPS